MFRTVLICAWAEKGADAMGPDGTVLHSDAVPPEKLVDTLGAGDTFNASVIYSLSNGNNCFNICTVRNKTQWVCCYRENNPQYSGSSDSSSYQVYIVVVKFSVRRYAFI